MAVRYVDADSTAGGDGTTAALEGANRAYATLAEWETARQGVLAEPEECVCGSAHANHTVDATTVLISGWTTSADNYVYIHGTASEKTAANSGKWATDRYRLSVTNPAAQCIQIREEYVRLADLQVHTVSTSAAGKVAVVIDTIGAANDLRIWNCIFRGSGGTANTEQVMIVNDADILLSMWNCILYGLGAMASTAQITCKLTTFTTASIYSCLFIGGYYGLYNAVGTCTAKNCYASASNNDYHQSSGTLTLTTCASADTTGTLDNIACDTDTFVNVTETTEDYHLAVDGLSPLVGAGTDTTGDAAPMNFTTDIDGHARDATWDIGADAWVPAAGTAIPVFMHHYSMLRSPS